MRYALLIVLGIALLAAGCTGPQPAPAAPAPSCADYCPSLQHANCTGTWHSSGTYPSCICTFNCAPSAPPATPAPPVNNTPPANATPPTQNVSPPANPAQPSVPVTNKSVASLLTDALASARLKFYSGNSGSFRETTYTWLLSPVEATPGELGGTVSARDVKFNRMVIQSIVASGFTDFTNTATDASVAYGVSIFRANSTLLDGTGAFTVDYLPPLINESLGGCSVYDTLRQASPDGSPLLTYYFSCTGVVGTQSG